VKNGLAMFGKKVRTWSCMKDKKLTKGWVLIVIVEENT
jgi:hypothetical protein